MERKKLSQKEAIIMIAKVELMNLGIAPNLKGYREIVKIMEDYFYDRPTNRHRKECIAKAIKEIPLCKIKEFLEKPLLIQISTEKFLKLFYKKIVSMA